MAGNPIDHREICELEASAALPPLPPHVVSGALVVARGTRWRVDACLDRHDCRELHLRATAGGERRVLLWPFDRPVAERTGGRLRVLPLARWTARVARRIGRVVDPLAPRAAFSGEVRPYQLAPAVAMAAGATRVVLADEVGLGKTIQAGWILADLLAREPDARVLVAVPAGLRDQWTSELTAFFSLAPARVDAAWLRSATADRPADVSPWAAPGVYLGSIDFLKRPDVARSLTQSIWDLVVVDEAHGAVAPTERHAAVSAAAAVSRRIVIITATPFSGDTTGFASMMSLGAMPGEPPPLMFRRSRGEVGDPRVRRHRFATVRIGRGEFRLQRLLERYTREVWSEAGPGADGARLAMTVLRKRALSSPAAALRSLMRRLELLRGATAAPRQLSLFEEEPEADEMLPDGALGTPGLSDAGREGRWLVTLIEAAGRAAAADAKQRTLLRLLSRVPGEAAIVFTEYRDTLRQLAGALPGALQLHGGLTAPERTAVQSAFNERGGLLLATDAAADGLNLQRRCRLIVNYELPWNPARLEQRIGRVDRIGQRRTVHAITLVARDTAEDLVVAAVARRLARVAAALGERDRLAALLTDAMTARAVIAGTPLGIDADGPAAPPLRRAEPQDPRVDAVAALLARAVPDSAVPWTTPVARVHASALLTPGWVAVVRASAVADGGVVAERPFLFHIRAAAVAKPPRQSDARTSARQAIAIAETAARTHPEICAWREGVQAIQETAVGSRLAREESLVGGRGPAGELQPGLFDGRAVRGAARLADADGQRRHDHRQYIRALHDSRRVRLECTVDALLIVWR